MRSALYTEIKKLYPVYYIGNIKKTAQLPFCILEMGAPIRTRLGNWNTFSVTAYAPLGDFRKLDEMCEAIINALHKKHIKRISDTNEGAFLIEYAGCSADDIESVHNALTKRLSFRSPLFGNDFF